VCLSFVRRISAASAVVAAFAQLAIRHVAGASRYVSGQSAALLNRPPNSVLNRTKPGMGCLCISHGFLCRARPG
jgi:hypothetical protein